jgi:CRP/FNR family transcriptional regulator, cyclic AMP receptor protein
MVMEIVAWIASLFVFISFFMKTMIPLRIAAIVSNLTFIVYALLGLKFGIFSKVYPIFVLHMMLLPLNILRLYQMKMLIKKVQDASKGDENTEYLIPYMNKNRYRDGDVLFNRGDFADRIYFIQEGSIYLPEVEKIMPAGSVLGEVGIFAPDNRRAATAVSRGDSVIYDIHRDRVLELYYQNPQFGFSLTRSVSRIVRENSELLGGLIVRNK